MKAMLKVNDNLTIEVEGETEAETFKQIASTQETFSHECCGMCKSKDIRFVVRIDKDENEYFELHCSKCRARLPFGQAKKPKGSLYPKRRWDSLSEGERTSRKYQEAEAEKNHGYLPGNGWFIYKKP